jgi:hypothetical protein
MTTARPPFGQKIVPIFWPGQAPKGPEKTSVFFREIKKSQTSPMSRKNFRFFQGNNIGSKIKDFTENTSVLTVEGHFL